MKKYVQLFEEFVKETVGDQHFDDYESWKDSFPAKVKFKDTGRGTNALVGSEVVGWWDDGKDEGVKFDLAILDENFE